MHFLEALEAGMVLTGDALKEWSDYTGEDIEDFLDVVDADENVSSSNGYDDQRQQEAVEADLALLQEFRTRVQKVNPHNDPKVAALIEQLATIAQEAEEESVGGDDTRNKRKVIIFTYYADTANYLDRAVQNAITTDKRLAPYKDRLVMVQGTDKAGRGDAITGFAPMTAGTGTEEDRFDIIVATDTSPKASTCSKHATSSTTTCPGTPCAWSSATDVSTGSDHLTPRCSCVASSLTKTSTPCCAWRSGCNAS